MTTEPQVGSLHGYDTVTLAVCQPKAFDGVRWAGEQRSFEGTVRRWRQEGLVHLTYVRMLRVGRSEPVVDELRLECSLPRVLYGTNVETVTSDAELVEALRAAGEVAAGVGACADWWSGAVRRVDVTANEQLADEGLVVAVLKRLADAPLRGRWPVRGESGVSLSWPRQRGSFSRKAYSKYVESGDERARGLLRLEVKCNGQQAVRRGMGAAAGDEGGRPTGPASPGSRGGPVVTAAALLGPSGVALRSRVGGSMRAFVRPFLGEVELMDTAKAFYALKARHRSDVAARLVGYALLVKKFGWEFVGTLVSRQAVWGIKKAFREAGVDPLELDLSELVAGRQMVLDELRKESALAAAWLDADTPAEELGAFEVEELPGR